jgi:hypothetical protein
MSVKRQGSSVNAIGSSKSSESSLENLPVVYSNEHCTVYSLPENHPAARHDKLRFTLETLPIIGWFFNREGYTIVTDSADAQQ